ncbi:UDP-N-acetyl-D-glucosamine 6-dehydrogenase [Streptomyces badius]
MAGSRILVVGVSYKPGVRDVRSSPALEIIELLTRRGAKVGYYDPLIQRVALADGTVLESIVEPSGSDWDAALLHTVQPDHDYAWVHRVPHDRRRDLPFRPQSRTLLSIRKRTRSCAA